MRKRLQVKDHRLALNIPAMERVRLDVRETSRNSENPSPNARAPPRDRVDREYNRGASSLTRNSFSEVHRLNP